MTCFRDYEGAAATWITIVEGDFFPDAVEAAVSIYEPVIDDFGTLIHDASDSQDLLWRISERPGATRTQLLRVFRKYVSPDTSVEMLKRKSRIADICRDFGERFRPLDVVRERFQARPKPDESLIALLNEYRDRGQKGYELSETFFAWFRTAFTDLELHGPERAGQDINLSDWLPEYPAERRPVDFVATRPGSGEVALIGLIRYDSDRGGAQEDDRTSGYRNVVREVLGYAEETGQILNLLFVNDGPGLLLGSMWRDYSEIEEINPSRVMVATLRMLEARLTLDWIND